MERLSDVSWNSPHVFLYPILLRVVMQNDGCFANQNDDSLSYPLMKLSTCFANQNDDCFLFLFC